MAEEPRLFLRSGLYGLTIAVVYYLWTQEIAGTVLLAAFGTASLMLVILLFRAWQRQGGHLDLRPSHILGLERIEGEGRVSPEVTRFPTASLTPMMSGLGLALAALSVAWGPAFLIAAAPFLLLAAVAWFQSAIREYPADAPVTTDDEPGGDS